MKNQIIQKIIGILGNILTDVQITKISDKDKPEKAIPLNLPDIVLFGLGGYYKVSFNNGLITFYIKIY